MVMEASPSPQSVGREFVRQYYTLLNKAPAHLHRFYNNYSSFVHGGLDAPNRETPPVIGQKQIHNRIQQLNFRDCHAKISQVDSQATLGNGVVVQVTGELSNGGAPMRRFTQTFVLAAQSPKKYYVHNDIFRYQDIVLSEEEGDAEGARSEGEEETSYFTPPPSAAPAPAPFPPAPPAPLHTTLPPQRPFDVVLSHLNGHGADDSSRQLVAALQASGLSSECERERERERERDMERERDSEEVAQEQMEEELLEEPAEEREPTPPPPAPQPSLPPPPPEPKTYANLLKSGGASHATSAASSRPNNTVSVPAAVPGGGTGAATAGSGGGASPPEPQPPRAPRASRPLRVDNPPPAPADTMPATSARRFSDNQQLFLGNLPHNATEEELRSLFGRFGAIAELRVHAKPGGAPMQGGRNPNYGFITYEEPQSAQNCLNAGPLFFPADDPDGCKLNVEEKKARSRGGAGGGEQGGASGRGGGRGGGRTAPPSHRPPFPSRVSSTYRR